MNKLWRTIHYLLHRKQFESELDEEFQHHLAFSGKNFGNIALLKEQSREAWSWTILEQFLQDFRYGLRAMSGSKLFTAMAIFSLALGIGVNSGIYSFMDAILLRALPVRHPEQLVILDWHAKDQPAIVHSFWGGGHRDAKSGFVSAFHPYAAIEFLKSDHRVFQSLFGFCDAGRSNLIFHGQAALADGENVSGGFFSGLGLGPAAGRLINDDDDRAGAARVVVLAFDYWRARFAADTAVIGQTLLIQNIPFSIAGVSAPGFYGVRPGTAPDFYVPLHAIDRAGERFADSHFYWQEAMGRLQPGVTIEQAQQALAVSYQRFIESTAAGAKEHFDLPALLVQEGGSGVDSLRRVYSKPLFILMAMAGLILTIACANIANLLLARATARQREMAVRLSLGAGRFRIVRQLLTESLLLSFAGGLAGILVAKPVIRLIGWLLANGGANFHLDASLDWRVLGFTLALAFATGLIFGLAPAIEATHLAKRNLDSRRSLLGRSLIVAQIALSLVLAVAASLFVRTLSKLESTDLGFDRDNVLLFTMNPGEVGYKKEALIRFDETLRRRLMTIPGVQAGTVSQFALLSGSMSSASATVLGQPARVSQMYIGPGFFTTMRDPILMGRELEEPDMTGPPAAVVNEILARKYFAAGNPLGRTITFGNIEYTIVGVSRTARYNSLKLEIPPLIYAPYTRPGVLSNYLVFALRTAGNPLALVPAVRQIVRDTDPRVPLSHVTTQSAQIDETLGQERIFADLCTCFAILALGICCVGLYGTMAYNVARRTSEIGVRMALGAQRKRVIWMVLREVFLLAAIGGGIGVAVAWNLSHFVESFLFGIRPNDPVALSIATATLAAAALAAGYAPAWKASRIDPMEALRHE